MIRNRPRVAILYTGAVLGLAVGATVAVAATADGEGLVGGAAAALFASAAAWCCLTARSGVLVADEGVIVRRYLRDRSVPWNEIVSFGLRPYRSKLGENVPEPTMVLRSGETVQLVGVEPPGRPLGISSKPVEFKDLEELDRLVQRRRASRWGEDHFSSGA